MSIVKIYGGLGNQMFQFAFFCSLNARMKNRNKVDIFWFDKINQHNGFELNKIFQIEFDGLIAKKNEINRLGYSECNYLGKIFTFLNKWRICDRQSPLASISYDDSVFLYKNRYYIGYWQSEKYFKDIEKYVRKIFSFIDIDSHNLAVAQTMRKENSVSVHVRRGDYIGNELYDNICTKEYYKKAIEIAIEKIGVNAKFYIFSNDISWCKENLLIENVSYIDFNNGSDSYKDMYLMSQCKANIIANSSFSWWGAWLNNEKNKIVISPSKWLNVQGHEKADIIPKGWIKI